jgi:16S rRNA (uracil1498-N3)-methyltransferase
MQFLFHKKSKDEILKIEAEEYKYLFKVRRHKKGDKVALRNLEDGYLYMYEIIEVKPKKAILKLIDKEKREIETDRFFHLLWCIIEPKIVEKTLPMLNEMGVSKISFIYCERSQKNFTLKIDKLKKILINSNQQCGRSTLMELEILKGIDEAVLKYDNIVLIDFCDKKLSCSDNIKRALIGPEGGLTKKERELFDRVAGFNTPFVLRSESAAVAIAAKELL